ncbi:MAG: CocE/NonD family hydrolase [Pseudomonadota bacterium]
MQYLMITAVTAFMTILAACSNASDSQNPSNASDEETATTDKVSIFGRYDGYSKPIYEKYIRSSIYVPMRDGVKLAVDIYRPAINGAPVKTPMPVLLRYSRYWRARELPDGSIKGQMGIIPPGEIGGKLEWSFEESRLGDPYLASHGYIIVRAESRGTGASQGLYDGGFSAQEALDGYDLIEWLAAQDFSNGKVGMLGRSYLGQVQYSILRQAPPSLKACFASVAYFDDFQSWSSGVGVLQKSIVNWVINQVVNDGLAADSNRKDQKKVARVDADKDGTLLNAAITERRSDAGPDAMLEENFKFRWSPETKRFLLKFKETLGIKDDAELVRLAYGPTDVLAETLAKHPEFADGLRRVTFEGYREDFGGDVYLAKQLPNINASGVPIYNWGGWRDVYVDGTAFWYVNLTNPTKLTLGPWGHYPAIDTPRNNAYRILQTVEQLRWFDHFLKGIDNGVMNEPSVNYAITHSEDEWEWRQADEWPVSNSEHKPFYFGAGSSDTIKSINDGTLLSSVPAQSTGQTFDVDYSATMGKGSRYYNALGMPYILPDLSEHAKTALTYTSQPLDADLSIAGHPIVRLQATSTASDGDFNVYLEEVDADGTVHFLSNGVMRASFRTLGDPPYDYLNMPWSEGTSDIVAATPPLNAGTVSLEFALMPIANRFEEGHRIRVVVTGADADGTLLIPISPPPTQKLMIGGASPSLIELPILD